MNIAPPGWAKDAIPTVRGWVSPKGELVKSQKIAQEDVEHGFGKSKKPIQAKNAQEDFEHGFVQKSIANPSQNCT